MKERFGRIQKETKLNERKVWKDLEGGGMPVKYTLAYSHSHVCLIYERVTYKLKFK